MLAGCEAVGFNEIDKSEIFGAYIRELIEDCNSAVSGGVICRN